MRRWVPLERERLRLCSLCNPVPWEGNETPHRAATPARLLQTIRIWQNMASINGFVTYYVTSSCSANHRLPCENTFFRHRLTRSIPIASSHNTASCSHLREPGYVHNLKLSILLQKFCAPTINFAFSCKSIALPRNILCLLTKVLRSLQNFPFSHKSIRSLKTFAFPCNSCIPSKNVFVSQKYWVPLKNIAFSRKSIAFPSETLDCLIKSTAFPQKTLCLSCIAAMKCTTKRQSLTQ